MPRTLIRGRIETVRNLFGSVRNGSQLICVWFWVGAFDGHTLVISHPDRLKLYASLHFGPFTYLPAYCSRYTESGTKLASATRSLKRVPFR